MLPESVFEICSQCKTLECIQNGSPSFLCSRMQSSVEIAVFSPLADTISFPIERYQWVSLPRQIVFVNMHKVERLNYEDCDLGLADILLYNQFADYILEFIQTGKKINHKFETLFARRKMWVGKNVDAMIEDHQRIIANQTNLQFCINSTLHFLKSKCKFISQHHFDCIRNICYLFPANLKCINCPWTKVAEHYQHGKNNFVRYYSNKNY